MTVQLRTATPADVPVLAALEQEFFGPEAWNADQVGEEIDGDERRTVVAEDDGRTVGYAVTRRSWDVLDLLRIAVLPDHRRGGVATRLMVETQALGRDDGAHRMLLEVSAANKEAVAFYAARDFVQIDRRPRYYKDGSDALVMRATLGTTGCSWRSV
jgi:[ribosomal protein S18]-alanine N-acetyltransferase